MDSAQTWHHVEHVYCSSQISSDEMVDQDIARLNKHKQARACDQRADDFCKQINLMASGRAESSVKAARKARGFEVVDSMARTRRNAVVLTLLH